MGLRILYILVISFIVLLLLWPIGGIVAQNAEGVVCFRCDLPPSSSIDLKFIHSIELTPVIDSYVVRFGKIILAKTRYKSLNNGLPGILNGFEKFVIETYSGDRWLTIDKINRVFDCIIYRVGNSRYGKNVIIVDEEVVANLYEICPNKRLFIYARTYPLIAWVLVSYSDF